MPDMDETRDTTTDTRHHLSPNSPSSSENPSSESDNSRHLSKERSDLDLDKAETQNTHGENEHTLHALESVRSAAHKTKEKLVKLQSIHPRGAFQAFNPTSVRVHFNVDDGGEHEGSHNIRDKVFMWRSRDNRKGRNSIAVAVKKPEGVKTSYITSPASGLRAKLKFKDVGKNLYRMFTSFPYWDMAFWSGWSYTWGSVLFVVDGGIAVQDLLHPDSIPSGVTKYVPSLCFFFGAILYQIGATMAYLEAVNDGSFGGSAMKRFLEGHETDQKRMLDEKIHHFFGHIVPHHHDKEQKDLEKAADNVDPEAGWKAKDRASKRPTSLYPPGKAPPPRRGGIDHGEADTAEGATYYKWQWYPKWHTLRTHHVYEIGYIACAIQLFGATLYGITGVVDLPGILDGLSDGQEEGAFWIPQIVASVCFLTASILFTLETQEKWYKPKPGLIGWWIGFWATVGSVGFLLSGSFGAASFSYGPGEFEADLSSLWGSAAYLTSSFLQWYEALNKHPVEELFNEPGEMKSYQVHPI